MTFLDSTSKLEALIHYLFDTKGPNNPLLR